MSGTRALVDARRPSAPAYLGRRLQRKCACSAGGAASASRCDECAKDARSPLQARLDVGASDDPFEREAEAVGERVLRTSDADPRARAPIGVQRMPAADTSGGVAAPREVEAVIASSGRPLDRASRAFFEPRFGADFSAVRVHDDASSAESARAVSAQAYTVGSHVVFGAGRYAPGTPRGRALLAHELTHVIQQRAVVQRASLSGAPKVVADRTSGDDDDGSVASPTQGTVEEAEEHTGIASASASGRLQRAPDDAMDGPWPEKDEASRIRAEAAQAQECLKTAPADLDQCDPKTPLGWGDFTGKPDKSGFSASTTSGLRERPINVAARKCMPASAAAQSGSRGVQAFFDPKTSWVRPEFSGNPAVNGCAASIADCVTAIGKGQTDIHLGTTPSANCPAAILPTGAKATTTGECTTVLGADCNARAATESARLLAHEQGHFDLSCAMAAKANAMLATAPSFDVLLTAAQTALSTAQHKYDADTHHGCNSAPQAAWVADIAAGLPSTVIKLPTTPAAKRKKA